MNWFAGLARISTTSAGLRFGRAVHEGTRSPIRLASLRCAVILLALAPVVAEARSEKVLAYPRDQAWPAAVRFLRVDAKLKVIERDAEAGYVLFELHEDKKTFRGSLEVIEVVKDGRHQVRLVLQIEDRPAWLEIEYMNKLEQKLRAELGSPAPAPSSPPAPKKPDDGKPATEPPKDDGPPISPTP
jgi:hypothetical protein